MLSVIIPCLNEAGCIADTLAALRPARRRGAEVIVVDGGSDDGTANRAAPMADAVISAPRGRASQMNAGARRARGEILLFLHADSRPPEAVDGLLIDGLKRAGRSWGRFDVSIDGEHPLLRVVGRLMNWRSRVTGIATGDQGIFVTRTLFTAAGGFRDIPLMEDIELSKRLKRYGPPLCLKHRIVTSGRRWEERGVVRTIFLMWRLRLAYWLGADPRRLAMRYGAAEPATACVIVFARAARPGTVKTRLIPLLGPEGSAKLHARMVEHSLAIARKAGVGPVELHCAPDCDDDFLRFCGDRYRAGLRAQADGDLGARIAASASRALAEHAHVLLIGADCPALTARHLCQARQALLGGADAVLAPAEDGGYVLMGLSRFDARLFEDIAWGSDGVLQETRARLRALGWRWRELETLWDVDRPEDYERLVESGLLSSK